MALDFFIFRDLISFEKKLHVLKPVKRSFAAQKGPLSIFANFLIINNLSNISFLFFN
jgi:hypothetical protein